MRGFIKFCFVLAALAGGGFLLKSFYFDFGVESVILSAGLVVACFAVFSIQVPQQTGAVLANFWGGHREVGPGFNPMFRLVEWLYKEVDLKKGDFSFTVRVMNANRDFLTLKVDVGTQPRIGYLFEHTLFDDVERQNAVQGRIESLLTELIHHYQDPDAVIGDRGAIEAALMLRFHNSYAGEALLELYYGLNLNYIFLSGVAPSAEVQSAADLKRIKEERCKALTVTMDGYDQEIQKMRQKDRSLSYLRALEILMAESGSAPRKVTQFETGVAITDWLTTLTTQNKKKK